MFFSSQFENTWDVILIRVAFRDMLIPEELRPKQRIAVPNVWDMVFANNQRNSTGDKDVSSASEYLHRPQFLSILSCSREFYCSDFRYESNGIFVLGVGFFFFRQILDFLTSHFSRNFFYHSKDIVVLSSNLKRYFTCDFFRKVTVV